MEAPRRSRAGSSANYLRVIADGGLTSPQAITRLLTKALGADDYVECIKNLPSHDIDPQSYIDGLDKARSRHSLSLTSIRSYSMGARLLISFRPNRTFTSVASGRSVRPVGYTVYFRFRTRLNRPSRLANMPSRPVGSPTYGRLPMKRARSLRSRCFGCIRTTPYR